MKDGIGSFGDMLIERWASEHVIDHERSQIQDRQINRVHEIRNQKAAFEQELESVRLPPKVLATSFQVQSYDHSVEREIQRQNLEPNHVVNATSQNLQEEILDWQP